MHRQSRVFTSWTDAPIVVLDETGKSNWTGYFYILICFDNQQYFHSALNFYCTFVRSGAFFVVLVQFLFSISFQFQTPVLVLMHDKASQL